MKIIAWTWFAIAQLLMLVMMVLGWFVLILPCLLQAWETSPAPSINDGRKIDRWRWRILVWADNPEDGISGQTALVWGSGANAGKRVPYMPTPDWLKRFTELPSRKLYRWIHDAWRAWIWSAWRNSTDQLKYTFALGWRGPQMKPRKILGRTLTGGWSVENRLPVLVLSWKR